MPDLRRNILSGAVLAVGNTLLILISYPLYLKYLGIERYGLWATISVVVNFTAIGRLGIDTAMIKYVAEEYSKKSKLGIEKYFSTAIVTLLIAGIVILLISFPSKGLLVSVLGIPGKYVPLANTLLPCMIILSILIFLVRATNGTLRGLGRVDLANYYDLGGRGFSTITALILLKFGYGVWSLFWGQVLFYLLLGFLAFFTIYKKLGTLFFSIGSCDLKYLSRIAGFGGTMTAAQLLSMLLVPFNKVVIARYISLSGVTYFEIADRAVVYLRSVFDMGIRAIMPEISRLSISEGSQERIDKVLRKAMRLVFYLGVPVFAIFFLFGPFLLRSWLSNRYTPEIAILFRIMLVGYVPNLLIIPIYYLFMGVGKVSYCFTAHLIQSTLNVTIVSILIVLAVASLYLFTGIYSLSVGLSAILWIVFYAKSYRSLQFG